MKELKHQWQEDLEANSISTIQASLSKGEFTQEEINKIGKFFSMNKGLTYKYLARGFMKLMEVK